MTDTPTDPIAAEARDTEPKVRRVILHICEPCIKAQGQECHTPGCIMFLHRVDIPFTEELMEDADAEIAAAKSAGRAEASAWRPGDEEARRGDLIQAAFAYHHSVTNYHYYEYAVVRWHDEGGYWCDAEGDIYTGPSDELPTWYRPFAPLPPPPEGGE